MKRSRKASKAKEVKKKARSPTPPHGSLGSDPSSSSQGPLLRSTRKARQVQSEYRQTRSAQSSGHEEDAGHKKKSLRLLNRRRSSTISDADSDVDFTTSVTRESSPSAVSVANSDVSYTAPSSRDSSVSRISVAESDCSFSDLPIHVPIKNKPRGRVFSQQDPDDPLNARIPGRTKIDTKELVAKIAHELKKYSIKKYVFAEKILMRGNGSFSDMLWNPKEWKDMKGAGRSSYIRLYNWLALPLAERLSWNGLMEKDETVVEPEMPYPTADSPTELSESEEEETEEVNTEEVEEVEEPPLVAPPVPPAEIVFKKDAFRILNADLGKNAFVDVKALTEQVISELRILEISQSTFCKNILQRDPAKLGDLLRRPTNVPYRKMNCLGKQTVNRMQNWIFQPLDTRLHMIKLLGKDDQAVHARVLRMFFDQTKDPSHELMESIAEQLCVSIGFVYEYFFMEPPKKKRIRKNKKKKKKKKKKKMVKQWKHRPVKMPIRVKTRDQYVMTDLQRATLLNAFKENPHPTEKKMKKLAVQLQLKAHTVSNFFKNTRVRGLPKYSIEKPTTSEQNLDEPTTSEQNLDEPTTSEQNLDEPSTSEHNLDGPTTSEQNLDV